MNLLQVDQTISMLSFEPQLVYSVAVSDTEISEVLNENDPVKRNVLAAKLGDELVEYFKRYREPMKLPSRMTLMQKVPGIK